MAKSKHTVMGGKVELYQRGDSEHWHCYTFLAGKKHRKSTKQDSLSLAKEIAEDWYRHGEEKSGPVC